MARYDVLPSRVTLVAMAKRSGSVLIVFTTVPKQSEAAKLSQALIKKRIVACATVLPVVRSFYRWKGKMVEAKEALIMLKTTQGRYRTLERTIKALHPYEVPEILAVPVNYAYALYVGWICQEVDD